MNVLLIGGSGSFIDSLIIKLKKEGHRVYLLTGSRYRGAEYQRVFERYHFAYDCSCIPEIFGSVAPDLTIYMGAFDTNYRWREEEADSVAFVSGIMNLLMGYAMRHQGRFIYLSSDEVYGGNYPENIPEEASPSPVTIRGMALAQAEELCESYRRNRDLELVILRLDHYYGIPGRRSDVRGLCGVMCLEALEKGAITVRAEQYFSLLYETDAVEFIYRVAACEKHNSMLYHISSQKEMSQRMLAELIRDAMKEEVEINEIPAAPERRILSGTLYESEFGNPFFCEVPTMVTRTVTRMKRHRQEFLSGDERKLTWLGRLSAKIGWLVKVLIPFMENCIAFIPFFMLNNRAVGSAYFANLDFYLLYVLLFAIVYGQQQATLSAVLAVAGYCFRQMYHRSGFEVMMDANTYVWIAQLFILGLTVGYMRDQIRQLKKESMEEQEHLSLQLTDIQDINGSNVRVKDALETQIINQNDSVGKIYGITSALDRYSPQEVLFYAVEMVGKLMQSRDAAIYMVSNAAYARLFSYTSEQAKVLGNSIRYTQMGELYETLKKRRVFINRKLDDRYPLMANGIYEQEKLQMIIMVWGIPWERMTLGQANQLVVISALIQNAALRANRYIATLENQRYIEHTPLLEPTAFSELVKAYMDAKGKGLVSCTLLKLQAEPSAYRKIGTLLARKLRESDYVGVLKDNGLYVLLANTEKEDARQVMERFRELGVACDITGGGDHDAA